MKKIIVFLCIGIVAGSLQAQQDPQLTSFIFHKLPFNPGYAGSKEQLTVGALYRHQWQGLEGMPRTLTAYMHTPFSNRRGGLGLQLTSDRIGLTNTTAGALSYAYRIPTGNGATLSIGLQAEAEYTQIDWSKADPFDAGDVSIGSGAASRFNPNFGAGVYYSTPRYFLGVSAPRFLRNALHGKGKTGGRDVRSYYLMAGMVFPLGASVQLQPNCLASINRSAPLSLDLGANLIFMNAFWIGANYRVGDSFDALVQYQFTRQLRAGIALDFTLSELSRYTAGSGELHLEYIFNFERDKVNNLRFF